MNIIYHSESKQFHLYNNNISYIITVLETGEVLHTYFGKALIDKKQRNFSAIIKDRPWSVFSKENNCKYCMQTLKREYPSFGNGDYRYYAYEIMQENGSCVTDFKYIGHKIFEGKKEFKELPATYVEDNSEAKTLEIILADKITGMKMILSYTIFRDVSAIARNTLFINESSKTVELNRALSMSVDFQDDKFELLTLNGTWGRERAVVTSKLRSGIQGIYSLRGASSSEANPFLALKRPNCTENSGEVFGFSLIYSGNHIDLVEVCQNNFTRVSQGIHPDHFVWILNGGDEFQTPESILVYSNEGINGMSQTYHKLYRKRLVRGYWRDKERPILLNNWEATGMSFTEEEIVNMAKVGKRLGVDLFVLDDGWFGNRDNSKRGLGDWYVKDFKKLSSGIKGLADKITSFGMDFGLWIEPEMVNEDSDLYRAHPDWALSIPSRENTLARNQYVLDFSNPSVVDYIFDALYKVISSANISYIKWDMNRYIAECYSSKYTANMQGEIYHRYILGVYKLYSMLLEAFPKILFESCAGGGGRFDPGMLYYAPQTWTSDSTDAVERLHIQYGTSIVYPLSAMGAHVSACPNHETNRSISIETRGNVAMFGAFGYELDVCKLSESDQNKISKQIKGVKKYQKLIQTGDFYRICSPFEEDSVCWMVVSKEKDSAILGVYKLKMTMNHVNNFYKLKGLEPATLYSVEGFDENFYGDELCEIGLPAWGDTGHGTAKDFDSRTIYITKVKNL